MTNHEPKHPPADMAGLDGLIEVTQADRDAAASGYFAWCSNNRVIPDRMKSGNADNHSMVQAFARHRATQLQAFADRIKALEAENERLRELLVEANAQAEHFERKWYLRGDENERLRELLDAWLGLAREHLDTELAGRTFEALERTRK